MDPAPLADIEAFCKKNSNVPPEMDKPYVVDWQTQNDDDEAQLRIFISTKRLLQIITLGHAILLAL